MESIPYMDSERWLGVEEIAEHLGVAPVTTCRWLERHDSKSIPSHRVGKLWKFKATEVDTWVSDGGTEEPSVRKTRAKTKKARD
jgi:excisionase family DNA binding protein